MQTLDQAYFDALPSSKRHQDFFDATIGQEILRRAKLQPYHAAMEARGFTPLSYCKLQQLIAEARVALRLAGFGRTSRIVIAVPDSKQAALAILAIACSAISVPLSPRLTRSEIETSLQALQPDVILLVKGSDSEARRAAENKKITILEVAQPKNGVFDFTIIGAPTNIAASGEADEPDPEAPAFILQTSGTTGKPKLIPFTHRNMLAVAARSRAWFKLTPEDRCLCVAPVFYAHGLKIAILTPLLTGGTVVFPTDNLKFDYVEWFDTLKPTWYSASPVIHRLVFDQTQAVADAKTRHSLRFILTSSAPIPQNVLEGLQNTLGVPLVEHYSSSEASLVAANLPMPAAAKSGSVGLPWPDTVIIVGEDNCKLSPGEQGEILVRGPTVVPGYLDAPDLNSCSYFDGWFKTGDIGSLDKDGFLTLHGRKSDVINRGGEKIFPAEIDDALLRHPAVVEAAAFPVAHSRLGEDVAAAVVLKPGSTVTPQDLRRFLQQTLASFKLPRRIHVVATLPKGNTGKIRRFDICKFVGAPQVDGDDQNWASPFEIEIASIWQRLLGSETIGPKDDFFELGGDSLLATQMLLELEGCVGRALPVEILFDNSTIRQLTNKLSEETFSKDRSLLVQLQPNGNKTPMIFIHGDFRQGGHYVGNLARHLGPDRTFYSLQSHGFARDYIPSIRQMAHEYKLALDAAGIQGPYCLGGHCNGALIALELANQLEAAGQKVELVIIIDAISLNARPSLRLVGRILEVVLNFVERNDQHRQLRLETTMSSVWYAVRWVVARSDPWWSLLRTLVWRAARKARRVIRSGNEVTKANNHVGPTSAGIGDRSEGSGDLLAVYHNRMAGYIPATLTAPMLSIVSESNSPRMEFGGAVWRNLTTHNEVVVVPGDHLSCVTTHAEILASHLRDRLVALDRDQFLEPSS